MKRRALASGSALIAGVAVAAAVALSSGAEADAGAAAAPDPVVAEGKRFRDLRPAARLAGAGSRDFVLSTADRGTIRFRVPAETKTDSWLMRSPQVVGDVNGDRVPDIAVAVDHVPSTGPVNRGQCPPPAPPHEAFVQVIFGGPLPPVIDVVRAPVDGFRVTAPAGRENFGASVAAAGDVNGDKLADLVIGAPGDADQPGSAYVVYGQASTAAIDVSQLEGRGFRIDGAGGETYQAGLAVAGGGDVNGDQHADVLIGAQWRTQEHVEALKRSRCRGLSIPPPRSARSVVYVVFGGERGGSVALGSLGAGGFSIGDSWKLEDVNGDWLANAGDVNGDALTDVLIGSRAGALLVFGRRSTSPINPDELGEGGIELVAPAPTNVSPAYRAVAGIGDINRDGLADVLLGDPPRRWYPAGSPGAAASSAYVVFGRRLPGAIDVRKLAKGGIAIKGTRHEAGFGVAALGDLNRDGLPDFGVLAPWTPYGGRLGRGSLYALFGKRSTTPLRLDALSSAGVRLDASQHGSVLAAGGAGALLGNGRTYVLVSDGYASAELVPFAPRPAPATPRLGPTLTLHRRFVTGLTYGFGSVWLLGQAGRRGQTLVYRLNPATNRIAGQTVAVGGRGRVIAAARGSIWVLAVPRYRNRAATLFRLAPRTGRILLRARVGGPGRDVDQSVPAETINDGFGSLWITYGATGSVYRVDPATGRTIATIKIGHYPQALTFAAGKVWVADREDGAVHAVDPRTNRVVGSPLDVSRAPASEGRSLGNIFWLGTAPDGRIWVYDPGHDQVGHIEPRTRRLTFSPASGAGGRIAVAAGASLWVISGSSVSRVRISDGQTIGGRLDVDTEPITAAATAESVWTTTLDSRVVRINR